MTGSATSLSFPESFLTTSVITVDSLSSSEEEQQQHQQREDARSSIHYREDGISEAGDTAQSDDENDVKPIKRIGKYLLLP